MEWALLLIFKFRAVQGNFLILSLDFFRDKKNFPYFDPDLKIVYNTPYL